jgi:hypothetical protein
MAFDWKEFLMPSRKKAAVAALLFVLFVPFINYWNGIMCIRAPCPSDSTGSLIMFLLLAPTHLIYQILYLNAIVGLALSYLLAAIAAPYYSKTKKPK